MREEMPSRLKKQRAYQVTITKKNDERSIEDSIDKSQETYHAEKHEDTDNYAKNTSFYLNFRNDMSDSYNNDDLYDVDFAENVKFTNHSCNLCKKIFEFKNKLFRHLRSFGWKREKNLSLRNSRYLLIQWLLIWQRSWW